MKTLEQPTVENTAHIDTIFERQKAFAPQLRHTSAAERKEKLTRLADYIKSHRDEVKQALYADFKKPAAEAEVTEILALLLEIKHTNQHLKSWMKPKKVGTPLALWGHTSKVIKEPKGTALIIAPWNYPFYLCIDPLVFAIAAGNTAVLKPSEFAPHTAAFIVKMIAELFPPEEVAVVEGEVETAKKLLSLPFNHIFFTGSPAVGKHVMRAAAEHLTSCTLELGGKSPAIVDETANLEDAASKLIWGKFMNCGQTCVAPDYVLVDRRIKAELIQKMSRIIEERYYTNEEAESSESYARIINRNHFDRLQGLLEDAFAKGAKVIAGGESNPETCYMAPTLIDGMKHDMRMMQEEIFGPILPIVPFTTLEEAYEVISKKEKPLALYIFSQKKKLQDQTLAHTTAGGTCINTCTVHLANPELPFGGVNNSGIGKTHGYYGFQDFSNERAVLSQYTSLAPVKMLFPPYGPKTQKLIDTMMRLFA